MKRFYVFLVLLFSFFCYAQPKAMSFDEAKKTLFSADVLDKKYKSALHSDEQLAVFKTEKDQEQLIAAYTKLLQDFGVFLKKNDFVWEKPHRCFNRIYISKEGKIDYFLYHFNVNEHEPEKNLTSEQMRNFKRLLNSFIRDYKFGVTAQENFAQCSPVVYKD
ncbi:hypothetical protein LZZ90_12010 [Flavobacterium sp. SM15]|uniref:hypothetical protein n=1 Tax=Flavobacterium sp. SM15 TaxID=2908005 RepID=UPI001EDB6CD7|nr:hypothetical protein [Flavobacterium sp. SM15]MCG2612232.1 hypothetical protein [Flavobacterium sp. SM15]